MPRSGVDVTRATAAGAFGAEWFLRIDLAATYRYTTCNLNVTADMGDGAGSQTWLSHPFNVGAISQSNQSPLDLSWIEIYDLDRVWSPLIFGSPGPRDKPIHLWFCQVDPVVPVLGAQPAAISPTLRSTLGMFSGVVGGADLDEKGVIRILVTGEVLWALSILRETGPNCGHDFKDENCQYSGVDTICKKTRADCAARTGGSNLLHFDGADWMMAADATLNWGSTTLRPPAGIGGLGTKDIQWNYFQNPATAPPTAGGPPGPLGDGNPKRPPIVTVPRPHLP